MYTQHPLSKSVAGLTLIAQILSIPIVIQTFMIPMKKLIFYHSILNTQFTVCV